MCMSEILFPNITHKHYFPLYHSNLYFNQDIEIEFPIPLLQLIIRAKSRKLLSFDSSWLHDKS